MMLRALSLDGGDEAEPYSLKLFVGKIGVKDIAAADANHVATGD